jgi:UDP-N-acetylglucosamine acyltransferase
VPVHPTAVIESGAEIAEDAEIGPYCVIGAHVVVGSGCRLLAHVHVAGHTTIGARTRVAPFASLGTPPQSVRYRGGPTRLSIGADCDIREGVTMNTGTEDGGGITVVGDRGLFMVGAHIGHDCRIGNDVIFANNAVAGGHVTIGDHVVLGGQAAIHQYVRIGEGAMVAGVSGVAADVIPFGFAIGQRAVLNGLNTVGIMRRGYSRRDVHTLRRAYRAIFFGPGTFRERLAAAEQDFADEKLVARVIAFLKARGRRPLMMPAAPGTGSNVDDAGL